MRWMSATSLSRLVTRDRALGLLWGLALAPLAVMVWWLLPSALDGYLEAGSGHAAAMNPDGKPGEGRKTAALAPARVNDAGLGLLPRRIPAGSFSQPREASPQLPAGKPPQPDKSKQAAAAGKKTTGNLQGPLAQPVQHARNAAVSACLPALQDLSRRAVDAPHVAFSTWNSKAANERLFQSIVSLKYRNKVAPHGISVLVAAPNPQSKCDGATVQVQPSALSCDRIVKNLTRKTKLAVRDLAGIKLIQTSNSMRLMLLPTRGRGCAVVGVGVFYAK